MTTATGSYDMKLINDSKYSWWQNDDSMSNMKGEDK